MVLIQWSGEFYETLFDMYVQNVEPNHAPSAEATYHPSNSAKNRYANIIACKQLYVVCGSYLPILACFFFVNTVDSH